MLIVSRYREELRLGEDKHEAMAQATERTAPAIGIAIMVAARLTLLPALLAVLGRRSFWPAIPRVGSEPRKLLAVWRRIGHLVHDRPFTAMIVVILVLAAGALGNLTHMDTLELCDWAQS